MTKPAIELFQAYGVELEYMIVDAENLSARAIADQVLRQSAGEYLSEVQMGEIAWSNELALHVIELKTNGPAQSLEPLAALFQHHVARINELLEPHGARLMPTAMHPWMDPHSELKLWPHEYNPIYTAMNRIFDCRGHGWANLQSVHLNLPFAGDEQFGRLHAAIRLLLPIMPALAASSPVVQRQFTGLRDNRMEFYRTNSLRIPSVTAQVIPEPIFSRADYERLILQKMYGDIAPLDTGGVLRDEWLNARGAIARFDRSTIEIRVLDMQECPAADLAICAAITSVLQALTAERWTSVSQQQSIAVEPLVKILRQAILDADEAAIEDRAYLSQFGLTEKRLSLGELWRHLIGSVQGASAVEGGRVCQMRTEPNKAGIDFSPLETILRYGTLSRRIERAIGGDMNRLESIYRQLCDCLAEGGMFQA